jgi:hypothetical protein
MTSAIDPTKPTDGVPSVKLDLRNNLQAARTEIEALQAGKADVGHQHVLGDLTDAGALAAKDVVEAGDIAAGAIGMAQLADAAVGEAKLADAAVTAAKLADAAVSQAKLAADAVGAAQLQDGIPIAMQGALLSGAELRDYSETSPAATISAGALTLDLATGSLFDVVLTDHVTSLSLTHPPAAGQAAAMTLILRQDATGGRTVTWPATIKWPGGAPPAVTSFADAVDVLSFVTRDAGATWYGFPGGQDFS